MLMGAMERMRDRGGEIRPWENGLDPVYWVGSDPIRKEIVSFFFYFFELLRDLVGQTLGMKPLCLQEVKHLLGCWVILVEGENEHNGNGTGPRWTCLGLGKSR